MRVVLVHDWLTGMRGGERVLERFCRMFPNAPIVTLLWNRGSVSPTIEARRIDVSLLQYLPAASSHYRWYLPIFPAAAETLRLPSADVVISSSHAVAKAVRVPDGAFHLSYVYTPMRYVWELEAEYFPPGKFPWPLSSLVRATCARLRAWDVRTSVRPHALVAISQHVADRIARHWGREAEIVYPPVALSRFTPSATRGDYDLVAGAFAPNKRADLAIEACRRLGRRLVVVGAGQDERRLRRLAGPNVEFRGWVDDAEMARLYAGARTLLFPGEEDFGIVPLEALASGCPVIAFGRGGVLETVGRGADPTALDQVRTGGSAEVPGGVLFGTQTADGLTEALDHLDPARFDPHALRALAEPFSEEAFDRGFLAALDRHHAEWRSRRTAPNRELD
jgi:glycosyltransferase involved in cell wall biosynthesis